MKTIDRISAIKISDISVTDLQVWLMDELNDLADDFDQIIGNDQINHIPQRLTSILCEKYRNWEPGKIHSIFQKGVSGAYGKGSKITVALLLSWITQEDRATRGENVSRYEPKDERLAEYEIRYFNDIAKVCAPFVRYCHEKWINMMDVDFNTWKRLRDGFNRGDSAVISELSGMPKYRSTSTFNEFKI